MPYNGDLYPTAGADVVMTTSGDLVKFTTERARLAIGSTNQILQVKSALPSWQTVPLADTVLTTAGDVLYENATPELARLPKGSDADVLTLASGLPSWAAPAGGGSWSTLADVTLTGVGQLSSGTFTAKDLLDIWIIGGNTISQNTAVTFNNDGTSNYKSNQMIANTYSAVADDTEVTIYGGNTAEVSMINLKTFYDTATTDTAYLWSGMNFQGGSLAQPLAFTGWGYYQGSQITRVDKSQFGSVNIDQKIGARVIVLGAI